MCYSEMGFAYVCIIYSFAEYNVLFFFDERRIDLMRRNTRQHINYEYDILNKNTTDQSLGLMLTKN